MIRGKPRLFLNSLFYAKRIRKRGIVFILVYALLASGVFLSIAQLEHTRSVLIRQSGAMWLNETGSKKVPAETTRALQAFIKEKKLPVSNTVAIKYAEFEKGNLLFCIDPSEPWAPAKLTPRLLKKGRFPADSSGEAVVSEGFTFSARFPAGATLKPGIGSVLKLKDHTITITGIIKVPKDLPPKTELMAVGPAAFSLLAKDKPQFLKEFIVLAKGSSFMPGLFGNILNNVEKIRGSFVTKESTWKENNLSRPATGAESIDQETSNALLFPLIIFGFLGSLVISLFYGYLSGRYHLREIAVLKTFGFNGMEISLYLLGELIFIALCGLVVSFVGVRLYYALAVDQAGFQLNDIYSLITGCILLLINIFGFVISSRWARRVDPMTLFRNI